MSPDGFKHWVNIAFTWQVEKDLHRIALPVGGRCIDNDGLFRTHPQFLRAESPTDIFIREVEPEHFPFAHAGMIRVDNRQTHRCHRIGAITGHEQINIVQVFGNLDAWRIGWNKLRVTHRLLQQS